MISGDATFVAPATPFGHSGVAVIRINGPSSCQIIKTITKLKTLVPRTATLANIYGDGNEIVDECIITKFKSPSSYTGDDLVEISCHGNPVIVDRVIGIIINNGARLAEPGEFTKRAFINGKIDLIQAEAVGALIQSKSNAAARINRQTLGGELSKALNKLNQSLVSIVGKIEHAIDISEVEIQESFYKKCKQEIDITIETTERVLSTFKAGKMLNEGIRVVITGKPNVGKSTLINYLSGTQKAIVSEIPGTTRDTVESMISIGGIPVRFIDTAGIHTTDDKVEKIGINKANQEIDSADMILYMFDDPKQHELPQYDCPNIYILNKKDLHEKIENDDSIIHISAKLGINVDFLLEKMKKLMSINPIASDTPHLTSQHQYTAINTSLSSQQTALGLLNHPLPEMELVAFELRESIDAIDTLLGKTSPDDILNNIFKTLCVGK